MEIDIENERRAFEYDFTKRKGNSKALLQRDPDMPGSYAFAAANLPWQGWIAGVTSFSKRKA